MYGFIESEISLGYVMMGDRDTHSTAYSALVRPTV